MGGGLVRLRGLREDGGMAGDPWGPHKRVWIPLLAFLGLVGRGWATWVRSEAARVVVYNETGTNWPVLVVTACGKSAHFRDVADEASVRLNLRGLAETTEIQLFIDSTNAPIWKGGVVDPSVGERHIVRVQRSGDVELSSVTSFVQRLLGHRGSGQTLTRE